MSVTTSGGPATASTTASGYHLTFGRIARSEWVKLRTLRSTFWCFVISVVLIIGLAVLIAAILANTNPGAPLAGNTPGQASVLTATTRLGVTFSQLVVAVLGVLVISGEYGTGMIRSTITAVPGRISALLAKLLVFTVSTFVLGLVSVFIGSALSLALLSGRGIDVSLIDPIVFWPLLAQAGYLALVGALAFGIGAVIRVSAGGIAIILGLLLVVPTVFTLMGELLRNQTVTPNMEAFLPSSAGSAMYQVMTSPRAATLPGVVSLDPWQGTLVMLAWVVIFVAAAIVLVKRRDA